MLKFPYGFSDFNLIRTENYFYIDRTSHIPLIETAGHQLLFLRPRRFGKSLLLSMLENYYDVAKADEFNKLFGNLAIGKNPTPLHNKYLIMKWDFSNINAQGTLEDIKHSIYNHINNTIEAFVDRYQHLWQYQVKINPQDALSSFQSSLIAIRQTPYRLYLLIDEYDNFANEVMMGKGEIKPERYKTLTSAEGSLKAIFRTVKSATSGLGLERVFITGASPILLSDMTTAYNVAENIYFKKKFNDLCGFKEAELKAVLTQVIAECKLKPEYVEKAQSVMKAFYNAYSFSDMSNELIYNPTLVLYFLKNLQEDCKFPSQMLDENLAMDLRKLTYLSRLPNGKAILKQALNGTPSLALFSVSNRFGIDDMLKINQSNQFIISILYYLGVLTLDGETALRKLRFKIPNLVVKKLYVEYLFEMLLPQDTEREQVRLLAEEFYQTVDLQPICDFMTQRYFKVFDNRDYKTANELTIKTAFLTVLFNDVWYMMDSEMPVERRYSDLSMIVRPDFRQTPLNNFLFEFKYLKLSEVKLTGNELKLLSMEEVETLDLVQEKLAEAEQQLLDYQSSLEDLQLISVVAVGFDRLVWKIVEFS
ncbi:AAA family ATPase [Candidatus Marithrix sp. Canyon 246]|uniref:AAA family ATPase n=1 Tax=Candidatus Marithrix sp. Canyon 246 TaxID=1827136 RepID=UPI00084A0963|nr:AAA family ATPase [Candidatus Marithrix sp. Canyon 246]